MWTRYKIQIGNVPIACIILNRVSRVLLLRGDLVASSVFIKAWTCKWAIFFVDTDECWCGGARSLDIHGGSRVAAGWSVLLLFYSRSWILKREPIPAIRFHTERKTDALISSRLHKCARKRSIWENAFASYWTACSRQASRQRQIICLANWSVV